ncbi:MAG: YihY/virulence factor BrkB family protein [Proteobacteria bacterium]|nr:YihY/virulence factor BrkB family protein [Pseudomonadota bacterium]
MIQTLRNWIEALIWGDMLRAYGLPGRIVMMVLRNAYAVLRDIVSGQLTLRAMSLVYTTLLSIVPLVAFSFSVLKGFGKHKELEAYIYSVQPLGPPGVEITEQLMTLVYNVNGNVLGGIGLTFLIYTAVSMVKKVEEAFNYVWYVTKPRSFAKRFTEYMFVLLIGPLAIVVALGAIASIGNESVVQWLQQNSLLGPVFSATSRLTPYLLVTGVFAFMYWYMPNTKVRIQSALIGGLAGGVMWATLGMIFATFIINSVRTQAIYAGLAIAISMLIWLYLNWLILLIGSQIAFYFQNPAYLRIGRREPRLSNAMRERVALNIMYLVGVEFREPKQGVTLRSVGRATRIPTITLAPIAAGLEANGILVSNENEQLLPGRDMSRISLDDILAVVRREGETGSHRDPRWDGPIESLGKSLDDAVAGTLSGRTLADLLDRAET